MPRAACCVVRQAVDCLLRSLLSRHGFLTIPWWRRPRVFLGRALLSGMVSGPCSPRPSSRAGDRVVNEPTPETTVRPSSLLDEIRARLEIAWQAASPGGTLPRIEDHLHALVETDRRA